MITLYQKVYEVDKYIGYKGLELKKLLIMITIFLVPFHYYICELFLNNSRADNLLRDGIIILLFCITYKKMKFSTDKTGTYIIIADVIMFVFLLLSIAKGGQASGKINIFRTYCIPTLAYFVFQKTSVSAKGLKRILSGYVVLMAIVSVYGVIASFVFGENYLIRLGYPSLDGHLAGSSYYINYFFGYPRNMGVFVGPNTAGVLFSFAIYVLLFSGKYLEIKHKKTVLLVLIVGLLSTFSRSAILGLVLSIIFVKFILERKRLKITKKKLFVIFTAGISFFIGVTVIDKLFLNQLFSRMLMSSFSRMLNGTDLSTQQHIKDLYEPLRMIALNPFGRGFGNNGPMSAEFSSLSQNVESSFYLMMYEMGPICGLFPILPYLVIIHKTYRQRKTNIFFAPAAISVTCLFTYLLLPNIQTYEILFFCYAYFGLYTNRYVGELQKNDKGVIQGAT